MERNKKPLVFSKRNAKADAAGPTKGDAKSSGKGVLASMLAAAKRLFSRKSEKQDDDSEWNTMLGHGIFEIWMYTGAYDSQSGGHWGYNDNQVQLTIPQTGNVILERDRIEIQWPQEVDKDNLAETIGEVPENQDRVMQAALYHIGSSWGGECHVSGERRDQFLALIYANAYNVKISTEDEFNPLELAQAQRFGQRLKNASSPLNSIGPNKQYVWHSQLSTLGYGTV